MKISVIIPVYNGEKFLSYCLSSIYEKFSSSFEVVVVNDASTDSTSEILKGFPCKIISLKERSYPASARNRGGVAASGEILFFLDSDTIITSDVSRILTKDFENPEVDAVQGVYERESENPNLPTIARDYFKFYKLRKLKRGYISAINSFCFAIRRDVFGQVGGFDEKIKTAASEDTDLALRLRERGHKILFDRSLKVRHLKKYTFFSLFKADFYKAKAKMKLFLRTRKIKGAQITISLNKVEQSIAEIGGIFLAPAVFLFLILGFVLREFFYIFLLVLFLFFVTNAGYLNSIRKYRGFFVAIGCGFIALFEFFFRFLGITSGFVEFLRGRRY